MAPLTVFLSHVTTEAKLADIVEGHILRDFIGLAHVFASSDQGSVLAGSQWLDEVTSALNQANLHIVLASPDSVERKWINFEAGAAHVRGVPIIPLCHSGLTPVQLPVPLSESQGLVLSDSSGFRRLYAAIAKALGSDLPDVDYAAYGREVAAFEVAHNDRNEVAAAARTLGTSTAIVKDPRALCISSQQFVKLGLENQLAQVLAAFPSDVRHDRVFDAMSTRHALSQDRFDIVHIAAFVCPRSGAVYFSDVDLRTGRPNPDVSRDVIEADDMVPLLRGARTRLAVITSCDALALATSLIATCHVVAARDMVSPKMMAAWVDAFYDLLPHAPLSAALDLALRASGAPMRLYAQQTASVDLRMERAAAVGETV
ncbi:MAG: TIR domain-containing protein [Vicinamibacterales bacterium]